MSIVKIPIVNTFTDQKMRLLVGGERYSFRFMWNSLLQFWTMNISKNGVLIVSGKDLSCGVELINQYNLPFRNLYAINLDNNAAELSFDETGKTSILVLVSDEEMQVIEDN